MTIRRDRRQPLWLGIKPGDIEDRADPALADMQLTPETNCRRRSRLPSTVDDLSVFFKWVRNVAAKRGLTGWIPTTCGRARRTAAGRTWPEAAR